MKFEEWLKEVPKDIKDDAVWSLKVYRIALFATDLCWFDIKPILDKKLFSLSDQLYRSVGSVSANITEGYSRRSHKEQARFYEIALGSAREGKDWYFKSRHVLGNKVAFHRIKILTKVAKLLLTMINERRNSYIVRENHIEYFSDSHQSLLKNVPMVKKI
ncbi:MAG TPA: four helix bundle protein [Balneolaceae bacterium]